MSQPIHVRYVCHHKEFGYANQSTRVFTKQDMTREQIGAEKVALQKALLYYEGIHGRPVSVCGCVCVPVASFVPHINRPLVIICCMLSRCIRLPEETE